MTAPTNLAAVRITLGALTLYIPANQVGMCSLVTQVVPEIPNSANGWGLLMSRRKDGICICASLTVALKPAGTYGDNLRM
jgi:hypothetical protein